jgi:hypothetical protein
MSALTIDEMLLSMERDLDEQGGAFYGGTNQSGRIALCRWLDEAYATLWASIVDSDVKGEWTGAKTTANYTANAPSMPLSTWSPNGEPLRIFSLWTAAKAVIPFVNAQDLPDLLSAGSTQQVAYMLGGDLYLEPPPTSTTALTMIYSPPSVQLHSGAVGDVLPALPGGVLWPAYVPRFPQNHYWAIPAYAVVLAEMAEAKPSAEHKQRAAMLERALLDTVSKVRQNQTLPGVRVSGGGHDYRY